MSVSLLQMLHAATPAASRSSAASPAATSPSSSSSTAPGVDLTNTFLQLLSVQLENQSPMNPVDPNQFVTQLATFDSLGELTQIQSLMQTLVNDVGGTGSASGAAASATPANATTSLNSISH
ncbi:MAG: flagellar hook capping FlgD N-terminal domain-containing protein [Terriglobales bacterium]|jgi:flagellar basal-body rod modification protein FlgD